MNHHRPTEQARIFVSPPHMSTQEPELLLEAFDSNWIAPMGPHVEAFEREFAEKIGVEHAVALSSGTAALHLAMLLLDLEPGDEVATSTLTFVATANAIRYVGARPVFIDSGIEQLEPRSRPAGRGVGRSRPARAADQGRAGRRRPGPMCRLPAHPPPCAAGTASRWSRTRPRPWGQRTAGKWRARSGRSAASPSTATRSSPPARAGCWSLRRGHGPTGPASWPGRPAAPCRTTSIPRSATTMA